jgi:hypothetical protein
MHVRTLVIGSLKCRNCASTEIRHSFSTLWTGSGSIGLSTLVVVCLRSRFPCAQLVHLVLAYAAQRRRIEQGDHLAGIVSRILGDLELVLVTERRN